METNLSFDKIRYLNLLKKEKTYLSNENREEKVELRSYKVILENQALRTLEKEILKGDIEKLDSFSIDPIKNFHLWDFRIPLARLIS